MTSLVRASGILLLFSCVALTVAAQKPASLSQDTIARVGHTVITANELIRRLELMPFPGTKKIGRNDSLKINALLAMVAEKLLAHEARRLGLPEDKRTSLMHRELENALIRDELYKREIVATSKPRRNEINTGMTRFTTEIKVLSFLVRTEADGEKLAGALLTAGKDSVLHNAPAFLYTQVDTIMLRFGVPDTSFENAAFAIGESRVSKTFFSSNFGWVVLYVMERRTNLEAAKLSLVDRRHRVEQVLQARHENERGEQYLRETLKSKHAKADGHFFNLLADSIVGIWKEDTARYYTKGAYTLTSDMVDLILDRLQPFLDSTLIAIDNGDLTLGEVLEMFRYKDFRSKALQGKEFRLEFNEALKSVAAQEILMRKGRNQGLQYSPAVQNDVQVWADYWAAGALYYRVRDSVAVSEEEILQHLVKHKEIFGRYYEVDVREVLSDSLQGVGIILEKLQSGQGLAELASRYSRRAEWAKSGGRSGYFQVLRHPEIGFEAMNADTGRLIGPVRIPEGYSLFEVLGKRRTRQAVVGFDTLKQNVYMHLLAEKRKQSVDRYIANLAREQHVTVDFDKLKRVQVSRVPMFTRRFLGFGGSMTAVPMLMQRWNWIGEYEQPPAIVP